MVKIMKIFSLGLLITYMSVLFVLALSPINITLNYTVILLLVLIAFSIFTGTVWYIDLMKRRVHNDADYLIDTYVKPLWPDDQEYDLSGIPPTLKTGDFVDTSSIIDVVADSCGFCRKYKNNDGDCDGDRSKCNGHVFVRHGEIFRVIMKNLLEQVQQCGDQLFDFQDSVILEDLAEIGIIPKRSESDSTPYILYFEGSLFKLNNSLGLPSTEFLRDGGQYYFPPVFIIDNMDGGCNAGIVEVDELDSSVKISFEDPSHALAFIESFIREL